MGCLASKKAEHVEGVAPGEDSDFTTAEAPESPCKPSKTPGNRGSGETPAEIAKLIDEIIERVSGIRGKAEVYLSELQSQVIEIEQEKAAQNTTDWKANINGVVLQAYIPDVEVDGATSFLEARGGERVQIVVRDAGGWAMCRAEASGLIGWIPSPQVTELARVIADHDASGSTGLLTAAMDDVVEVVNRHYSGWAYCREWTGPPLPGAPPPREGWVTDAYLEDRRSEAMLASKWHRLVLQALEQVVRSAGELEQVLAQASTEEWGEGLSMEWMGQCLEFTAWLATELKAITEAVTRKEQEALTSGAYATVQWEAPSSSDAELAVVVGDRVQVVEASNQDWIWCRADSGAEGWVPRNVLQMQKQLHLEDLPPFVKEGLAARWWSNSSNRFHEVTITSVNVEQREVKVVFNVDKSCWKTVSFDHFSQDPEQWLLRPQEDKAAELRAQLPSWVQDGGSGWWWSCSQKRCHPVTMKEVCTRRRAVIAIFDSDHKVRKQVPFHKMIDDPDACYLQKSEKDHAWRKKSKGKSDKKEVLAIEGLPMGDSMDSLDDLIQDDDGDDEDDGDNSDASLEMLQGPASIEDNSDRKYSHNSFTSSAKKSTHSHNASKKLSNLFDDLTQDVGDMLGTGSAAGAPIIFGEVPLAGAEAAAGSGGVGGSAIAEPVDVSLEELRDLSTSMGEASAVGSNKDVQPSSAATSPEGRGASLGTPRAAAAAVLADAQLGMPRAAVGAEAENEENMTTFDVNRFADALTKTPGHEQTLREQSLDEGGTASSARPPSTGAAARLGLDAGEEAAAAPSARLPRDPPDAEQAAATGEAAADAADMAGAPLPPPPVGTVPRPVGISPPVAAAGPEQDGQELENETERLRTTSTIGELRATGKPGSAEGPPVPSLEYSRSEQGLMDQLFQDEPGVDSARSGLFNTVDKQTMRELSGPTPMTSPMAGGTVKFFNNGSSFEESAPPLPPKVDSQLTLRGSDVSATCVSLTEDMNEDDAAVGAPGALRGAAAALSGAPPAAPDAPVAPPGQAARQRPAGARGAHAPAWGGDDAVPPRSKPKAWGDAGAEDASSGAPPRPKPMQGWGATGGADAPPAAQGFAAGRPAEGSPSAPAREELPEQLAEEMREAARALGAEGTCSSLLMQAMRVVLPDTWDSEGEGRFLAPPDVQVLEKGWPKLEDELDRATETKVEKVEKAMAQELQAMEAKVDLKLQEVGKQLETRAKAAEAKLDPTTAKKYRGMEWTIMNAAEKAKDKHAQCQQARLALRKKKAATQKAALGRALGQPTGALTGAFLPEGRALEQLGVRDAVGEVSDALRDLFRAVEVAAVRPAPFADGPLKFLSDTTKSGQASAVPLEEACEGARRRLADCLEDLADRLRREVQELPAPDKSLETLQFDGLDKEAVRDKKMFEGKQDFEWQRTLELLTEAQGKKKAAAFQEKLQRVERILKRRWRRGRERDKNQSLQALAAFTAAISKVEDAIRGVYRENSELADTEVKQLEAERRRTQEQTQVMFSAALVVREEKEHMNNAWYAEKKERQKVMHKSLKRIRRLTEDMKDLEIISDLKQKHSVLLYSLRMLEGKLKGECQCLPSDIADGPLKMTAKQEKQLKDADDAFEEQFEEEIQALRAAHGAHAERAVSRLASDFEQLAEAEHARGLQASRDAIERSLRAATRADFAAMALKPFVEAVAKLDVEAIRHEEVAKSPLDAPSFAPKYSRFTEALNTTLKVLSQLQEGIAGAVDLSKVSTQSHEKEWEAALAGTQKRWREFCERHPETAHGDETPRSQAEEVQGRRQNAAVDSMDWDLGGEDANNMPMRNGRNSPQRVDHKNSMGRGAKAQAKASAGGSRPERPTSAVPGQRPPSAGGVRQEVPAAQKAPVKGSEIGAHGVSKGAALLAQLDELSANMDTAMHQSGLNRGRKGAGPARVNAQPPPKRTGSGLSTAPPPSRGGRR
mmetsp:Transcript_168419/g.541136  ORF Transcript_168419/g.541136 Transcript_168419/m.541136 type:complete len:1945 (-) Transcript_168419:150-5984(-)